MQSSRWGLVGLLALAQLTLHGCALPSITIPITLVDPQASNNNSYGSAQTTSGTSTSSSDTTPAVGTVVGVTSSTIVAGTGLTDAGANKLACGTTATSYTIQAVDNDVPNSETTGERVLAGLQPSTTYYCQITYSTGGAPLTFTSHTADPLPSTPITGLSFGTISRYNAINPANQMDGDTFYNCKSSDGSTYVSTDDTYGWQESGSPTPFYSALSLVKFTSENPLAGITVSQFQNYGLGGAATGPDNRSQKDGGVFCMAGRIFMLIGRQLNQATGGMGTNTAYTQYAGQMIWSPDHGATWNNFQSPSSFAANGNPTNPVTATMFPGVPGQFGSAAFVMYCADNGNLGYMDTCNVADNANAYVYLMANDGYWDSGNVFYLARVPRAKMSHLQPSDYQFFVSGDGRSDSSWTNDQTKAQAVLSNPGKLGEPNVQYIPSLNRYLLLTFSYPDGLAVGNSQAQNCLWLAYEAPHPWGPWTLVNTTDWPTQGYYNPIILNDSVNSSSPTIMFTDDFWNWPNYQMFTTTMDIEH